IQPFLVDYDELTHFCKDKGISEVVLAGDIMSYHEEKYDILQQSASFKNEGISVVSVRANHYFKPSKTRNNKGEPYKVFTSFYKKWRPYLMKR
ncbi:deoxyribodipyrimidine photo-lyase, partial [Staphylococcus warneri]